MAPGMYSLVVSDTSSYDNGPTWTIPVHIRIPSLGYYETQTPLVEVKRFERTISWLRFPPVSAEDVRPRVFAIVDMLVRRWREFQYARRHPRHDRAFAVVALR